MESKGDTMLADAEVAPEDRSFERWVEARYRRQVHTVRIPAPARIATDADVQSIATDFEAEYERLFGPGSALKDAGIEMVDYGVDAVGDVEKPQPFAYQAAALEPLRLRRPVYCPLTDAMVDTQVYEGIALPPGTILQGPAVIEHSDTTIVLLTGQSGRIDEHGNTRITASAKVP